MYRDLPFEVACLLIWSLLAVTEFSFFHLDPLIGFGGILLGLLVAVPATRNWLRRLEVKQEIRPTSRTAALALIAIVAVFSVLVYVGISDGVPGLLSFSAFAYAFLPPFWGVRALLLVGWERSHHRRIMIDGLTVTRTIPVD